MSLGCTPQNGKVLNYNSSVNNQLVHKSSPSCSPSPKSRISYLPVRQLRLTLGLTLRLTVR